MALNGTEFVNNTLQLPFKPFTDLFQNLFGNGDVFYLVPLIGLTIALWYKTEEPVLVSMFMIGSGSILTMSSLFIGVYSLGGLFTIFTAMGITTLVITLILNRRG